MWLLTIEDDEGSTLYHRLSGERCTLGRAPDRDIVLAHYDVSRRHARLERRAEGWFVIDEGSENGSYLNDLLVEGPTPLGDQDCVQLGGYRLTLSSDHDTSLLTPAPRYVLPARLRVLAGTSAGAELSFGPSEGLTIGHGDECDLRLVHGGVKRVHALVRPLGGGRHEIVDKSGLGFLVNGRRLSCKVLEAGDAIGIGGASLLRYLEPEQAPDPRFDQTLGEVLPPSALAPAEDSVEVEIDVLVEADPGGGAESRSSWKLRAAPAWLEGPGPLLPPSRVEAAGPRSAPAPRVEPAGFGRLRRATMGRLGEASAGRLPAADEAVLTPAVGSLPSSTLRAARRSSTSLPPPHRSSAPPSRRSSAPPSRRSSMPPPTRRPPYDGGPHGAPAGSVAPRDSWPLPGSSDDSWDEPDVSHDSDATTLDVREAQWLRDAVAAWAAAGGPAGGSASREGDEGGRAAVVVGAPSASMPAAAASVASERGGGATSGEWGPGSGATSGEWGPGGKAPAGARTEAAGGGASAAGRGEPRAGEVPATARGEERGGRGAWAGVPAANDRAPAAGHASREGVRVWVAAVMALALAVATFGVLQGARRLAGEAKPAEATTPAVAATPAEVAEAPAAVKRAAAAPAEPSKPAAAAPAEPSKPAAVAVAEPSKPAAVAVAEPSKPAAAAAAEPSKPAAAAEPSKPAAVAVAEPSKPAAAAGPVANVQTAARRGDEPPRKATRAESAERRRTRLAARARRGQASVAELRVLLSLCREVGDASCVGDALAWLRRTEGGP
ncbi:MAG TPA: FHA domain-containing protein [Polyangiaceae bacterium]|nr:FHA domain-containing protein [Polyangiaceae bacterium]